MALNIHMDSQEPEPVATPVIPQPSNSVNNLNKPTSSRWVVTTADRYLTARSRFDDDDVRAPIPPVRQVLVHDHDLAHFSMSRQSRRNNATAVYEPLRDFRAEAGMYQ